MATVKVTEQKVILCGEYGVGKTSIFRRFANNTFVASNDRKSTLGLDNIDKEYVVEDRRIRVSVQCCLNLSFVKWKRANVRTMLTKFIPSLSHLHMFTCSEKVGCLALRAKYMYMCQR